MNDYRMIVLIAFLIKYNIGLSIIYEFVLNVNDLVVSNSEGRHGSITFE